MAIDFHGGPRASLLTWLSGAPVRIGYEIAGPRLDVHDAASRGRASCGARHSVENQWDLLATLGIAAARSRRVPGGDGRSMPRCAAAVDARLTRVGRCARRRADRRARQRRQPVPPLAGGAVRRARGGAGRRRARRRIIVTSGPSDADAAGRVIADARARLGAEPRRTGPVVRRVLARRASRAARARSALHRRRQRAAAHRRDDRGADRRTVRADAAGAVRAVARRALRDRVGRRRGAALPAVRAARVRAGRLPVPDVDRRRRRSSTPPARARATAGHDFLCVRL